jgi:hypothetical protein
MEELKSERDKVEIIKSIDIICIKIREISIIIIE